MLRNIFCVGFLTFFIFACSENDPASLNLSVGEDFLEENLRNADVTEIEKGLQYTVLESSTNSTEKPTLVNVITADFHGTLIDGSVFWSSVESGTPLVINLSQLIPGCRKAIALMSVGEKWRVFIHPDLAYGEEGRPPGIPSNSTLIFDIKLHDIKS